MTSYTWILLILASLAATRAQELDLSDALFDDDDKPPAKPTVKPAPPKNSNPDLDLLDAFDLDPKKPAVVTPKPGNDKKKPSGGDLDLSDAFGPDEVTKKPVVPPRDRGTGGGSFDDKDLFDVNAGGEYVPDKGRIGGGGAADPGYDDQSGGGSEQPQGGAMAAILSSVGVALLGAASSYFAYQKKKLCFKVQGGEDPESGKNRGTQSDPQVLSNLLRSS
ncbi:CD99 molecule isoform X1 [Megalobrama amblycephala]|uniref:CD99 molecule isoform X1 n=1 Tax=Megalobrama amblycephala TaxID=75352 RepID=UPI0020146BAB|nr:CD99 molecule isoform X1 [Megalobrama amblycephala]